MVVPFDGLRLPGAVVTSNSAPSRFEAVSSGPITRKVSGFARITSRRYDPAARVASLNVAAGTVTSTA